MDTTIGARITVPIIEVALIHWGSFIQYCHYWDTIQFPYYRGVRKAVCVVEPFTVDTSVIMTPL